MTDKCKNIEKFEQSFKILLKELEASLYNFEDEKTVCRFCKGTGINNKVIKKETYARQQRTSISTNH